MNDQFLSTFLNEIEFDELKRFVENPTLVGAVRKVLLSGAYFNGTLREGQEPNPARNFALAMAFEGETSKATFSNEQLGADLRASAKAIQLIESGFKKLDDIALKPKEGVDKKNPAR